MVLALYFFKRFFKYIFLINISLTFLFSFIEFFEKLIRVKYVSIGTILHFILLNTTPSFFETLPLSSWLAACLLIKEFAQQNEWETIKILNINHKKIFNLFLLSGILLGIFSFIGKEKIVIDLANRSEKFKQEKLKQNTQQKIINKWFILSSNNVVKPDQSDQNIFCYFQFLDLKTQIGSNLIILYMTSDFKIEKTISSPTFKVDLKTKNLQITQGTSVDTQNNTQIKINNQYLYMPSFFTQLQLNTSTTTLSLMLQNLLSSKNLLPKQVYNDLLAQLLKRLLFHLQVIIYPLLTFCLFFLFPFHPTYKWILIFLPYPIITILDIFAGFIVQKGISAIFLIIPYLILIIGILISKKRLEKTF